MTVGNELSSELGLKSNLTLQLPGSPNLSVEALSLLLVRMNRAKILPLGLGRTAPALGYHALS